MLPQKIKGHKETFGGLEELVLGGSSMLTSVYGNKNSTDPYS